MLEESKISGASNKKAQLDANPKIQLLKDIDEKLKCKICYTLLDFPVLSCQICHVSCCESCLTDPLYLLYSNKCPNPHVNCRGSQFLAASTTLVCEIENFKRTLNISEEDLRQYK